MRKIFSLFLLFGSSIYCPPHNVEPTAGYKTFRVELEFCLKGDELVIAKPWIVQNDWSEILCECGDNATMVHYKGGKTIGYCDRHIPDFNCSCGCKKRAKERKKKDLEDKKAVSQKAAK